MSAELDHLASAIAADGFAFQRRNEMRRTLDGSLSDWASFAASWDDHRCFEFQGRGQFRHAHPSRSATAFCAR